MTSRMRRRSAVAAAAAMAAVGAMPLAAAASLAADPKVPNVVVPSVSYDAEAAAGPAGTTELGTVHLEDSFGRDLAGVQVTLELDTGFFTDGVAVLEPGTYDPTLTDLGNTLTVSTDSVGNAVFRVSMSRDVGFDDDGVTTQVVTGEVDGATDSDSIQWSSSDPLNVSEISVVRTPGEPEVGSTNDGVLFDVYAKDQFGNAAKGVDVQVECSIELGDDDTCPSPAFAAVGTSDLNNGGDLFLTSDEAGLFEYTAQAVNPTTFIYDSNLVPQPADPNTTFVQEFYQAEPPEDGATYTIDPLNTSTPVPVDEPVTVTVMALDRLGNPLSGLGVTFVRTSDADNDQTLLTDGDGLAQYVFEGTSKQCGEDDTVTAVIRNGITIAEVLVTHITFEKCAVQVSLEGKNSQNGNRDILTVNATSAGQLAGTPVHMIAKRNGRWVPYTNVDRFLNAAGKATFSVKDENGHRITRYRAVLAKADDTAAARSQVLRRR